MKKVFALLLVFCLCLCATAMADGIPVVASYTPVAGGETFVLRVTEPPDSKETHPRTLRVEHADGSVLQTIRINFASYTGPDQLNIADMNFDGSLDVAFVRNSGDGNPGSVDLLLWDETIGTLLDDPFHSSYLEETTSLNTSCLAIYPQQQRIITGFDRGDSSGRISLFRWRDGILHREYRVEYQRVGNNLSLELLSCNEDGSCNFDRPTEQFIPMTGTAVEMITAWLAEAQPDFGLETAETPVYLFPLKDTYSK